MDKVVLSSVIAIASAFALGIALFEIIEACNSDEEEEAEEESD